MNAKEQKKQLEWWADSIEAVLARRGIAAQIPGGNFGPRRVRFNVQCDRNGVRLVLADLDNVTADIARALGVAGVTVDAGNGGLNVLVPQSLPVTLRDVLRASDGPPPDVTAALGLCEDGAPLLIRLPGYDVGSMAVVGRSALGLLRVIALSLALRHPEPGSVPILIAGGGLEALGGLPQVANVHPVALGSLSRLFCGGADRPTVVILTPDGLAKCDRDAIATIVKNGPAAQVYPVVGAWSVADLVGLPAFGVVIETRNGGDCVATCAEGKEQFTPVTCEGGELAQALAELGNYQPADMEAVTFRAMVAGLAQICETWRG